MRRIAIFMLTTGLTCAVADAAIQLDTVVLALPFNEGGGHDALDVSGKENHGKLRAQRGAGEFEDWKPGQFGTAIRFMETNNVEVENSPTLDISGPEFTLALFFALTEPPAWSTLVEHNNARGAETTGWNLAYAGERFVFHVNSAAEKTAWTRSSLLEDPELDRFYHVALVKSGVQYTYYLDGEEYGVIETDEPVPPADAIGDTMKFGSFQKPFFAGMIDEVVLSTQAWAIGDVRTHRDAGIQGVLDVRPRGKLTTSWADVKSKPTPSAR